MHVSPPCPAHTLNMLTLTCMPVVRCRVCLLPPVLMLPYRFRRAQATIAAAQSKPKTHTMQMCILVSGSRLGHGPASTVSAACAAVEDTSAAASSAAAATLTTRERASLLLSPHRFGLAVATYSADVQRVEHHDITLTGVGPVLAGRCTDGHHLWRVGPLVGLPTECVSLKPHIAAATACI